MRSNAQSASPEHFIAPFDVARVAADGVTVITPNRRLAAALKQSFDAAQQHAGHRAWASPDILPITTFLERTFARLKMKLAVLNPDAAAPDHPQLLDASQSQLIWEHVIRQSDAGGLDGLLSIPQTAKQAVAAWTIANQWQLLAAMRVMPLHDDGQAFLAWARRYQQRLREMNGIDQAMLSDELAEMLTTNQANAESAKTILPDTLLTAGFDIVTPQHQRFLQVCGEIGVNVESLPANNNDMAATVSRLAFDHDDAELRAAAKWAREQLEVDANRRLAIVVPNLRDQRSRISRVLTDALQPSARAEMAMNNEAALALFNISLGQPLSDYALAHDALRLIEFAQQRPIAMLDFSALLRSPFIAGADTEMARRAHLDAVFRDRGVTEISLFALQKQLKLSTGTRLENATRACPKFSVVIDQVALLPAGAGPAKKSSTSTFTAAPTPHDWSRHFTRVLRAWRFPGDRPLGSVDFQVWAKFRDALETLAALQSVQPRMRADEALAQLRRIVADAVFQPESANETEAPIQVLGILESAGQALHGFDAMWVTGLSDDAWPLAARPNPFIPVSLQRRAGVIEASAAASLALDQRITDGWLQSAATIIFSHACFEGGNSSGDQPRAASALIKNFPLVSSLSPVAAENNSANYAEALVASVNQQTLEFIPDESLSPLPAPTTVAGGATIMRDQAACPFRAFARHRLGAATLATPQTGLDAADRGTLLHQVMALTWGRLKRQDALLVMPQESLDLLVAECVQHTLADAHANGESSLVGRFAEIENTRLRRVVMNWLDLERARPPFVVVACEQNRQVEIGGLNMRLRLDRLDRLGKDGSGNGNSGGQNRDAVIDYKTGPSQVKSWLGDRPDEPQLPLYFHTAENPVSAVAFARLKRGKTFGFEGLSAEEVDIPGVSPVAQKRGMDKFGIDSWQTLTKQWQVALENLANEFTRGVARVDPKHGAPTCQQCDLQSVCRIAEINAAQMRISDDENGDDGIEVGGGGRESDE